jgi:hypothetical protein
VQGSLGAARPLASQANHPGPSWPAASGNLGAPQVDPAVRPSDRAQGQDILFYAGVDGHVFFPHVLSHYKNKKIIVTNCKV